MTDGEIKLNLGCGIVYKPGYLNIDKFNSALADEICDAQDLPFDSNTVDRIEAIHLIEHFDYIHSKYVLSEWFRVLKPFGKLIIETPDLEKSFKKFNILPLEMKKVTLQWIYGIDSPGMQHKTGFSFKLIKDLLKEIGFEKISKEEPKTYLYEPGMRISCQKPEDCKEKELIASFRTKLKIALKIEDSFLLLILENWIKKLFDIFLKEFKKDRKEAITKMISKISICHPKLPQIFLREGENFGFLKKGEVNFGIMDYLIEIEFQKRLFTLWEKRKKRIGRLQEDFENFILEIETFLRDLVDENSNFKEKLSYIETLEPANIKIFDFQIIQLKARELFNQGVKEFFRKNFLKALNLFLKSVKINPNSPLSFWNAARLKIILNYKAREIENDYKNSLFLTLNKKVKNEIKKELKNFLTQRSNLIPKVPIPEDYL